MTNVHSSNSWLAVWSSHIDGNIQPLVPRERDTSRYCLLTILSGVYSDNENVACPGLVQFWGDARCRCPGRLK